MAQKAPIYVRRDQSQPCDTGHGELRSILIHALARGVHSVMLRSYPTHPSLIHAVIEFGEGEMTNTLQPG